MNLLKLSFPGTELQFPYFFRGALPVLHSQPLKRHFAASTIIIEMKRATRKSQDSGFADPASEYLAWLMDSSIQIGPVSIGLDGLIGLIPGVGDVATSIMSGLIILRAVHHGVHRAAILRMLMNVGFDTLAGSIPLAGDVFDFAYKSNTRNLQIYREAMRGERNPRKDWAFVAMVVIILIAMALLPILGLIYLIKLIAS